VKRIAVALATTGLLATTLGVGALAQPASAADVFTPVMASAGTKKVTIDWAHSPVAAADAASGSFDALFVTLDKAPDATPESADRVHIVDASATSTQFDDLNSNTTYYASVFAIDYTATTYAIVPPQGGATDTPLGSVVGTYSPLTILSSSLKPLSGTSVTVSGRLEDSNGDPLDGEKITLYVDSYPQGSADQPDGILTDPTGHWSWTSPALTINTSFWAEYRDTAGVGGWTGRVDVEVRKNVTLNVTPGTKVPAGTEVKFSGKLGGDPLLLSGVQVCLQKVTNGAWKSPKCGAANADGTYLIKLQLGAAADGKYRTWSGMGPAYGDSWSKPKKMTTT
jgi:hypothetical protein